VLDIVTVNLGLCAQVVSGPASHEWSIAVMVVIDRRVAISTPPERGSTCKRASARNDEKEVQPQKVGSAPSP